MDRRSFILGSVAGLTGFTWRHSSGAVALRERPELRIALLPVSDALRAGIMFGLQEAQHAARLFDASLVLREFAADDIGGIVADRCTIVIAENVSDALARAAADASVLILDAGGAVRCGRLVFHLSRVRSPTELVWHHELERYGAAQLNARYEAAAGVAMNDAAWLGWMAVKIAWEVCVRTRSTEPRILAEYLVGVTTVFDGHKGRPLRFDPNTRVLDQPYYRSSDLEPVSETATAKGACTS